MGQVFAKSVVKKGFLQGFASKTLSLTLSLVLATQPVLVNVAQAQEIIIDPSGNVGFAPVLRSGTTAPVVDVATPNAGGVSLNQYTQFNVGAPGVVLNNGKTASTTQRAGTVSANPNLTGAAANVIVNEVRGTTASSLTGAIEVAGQRANVVVANPNGVTCNGCTFINTATGTLTTGVPTVSGSSVLLDVTRGAVTVGRNGLNGAATGTTTVNLIGRTVSINGRVTATDVINIQGGAQSWDLTRNRGNGAATGTVGAATGSFAVDATAFGAMSAGRIQIIGTEAGLGVRTLGALQATTSDVLITSRGTTSVTSAIGVTQVSIASSAGDVTIERDVTATAGPVVLTSPTAIVTNSRTGLYGFSGVTLNGGRGSITMLGDVQSGAGVTASADMLSFGAYASAVGTISLTARYELSVADATIVADRVVVPNVGRVATFATSAFFTNADVAVTTVAFSMGRDVYVAPQLTTGTSRLAVTASGDFRNTADLRGFDASRIVFSGALINEVGGVIDTAALSINSTTRQITNAGVLTAANGVSLSVASFTNAATGSVVSNWIAITTTGALTNLGSMTTAGDMELTAGTTLSTDGFIQAARVFLTAATITAKGNSDTRASGVVVANATTAITNDGFIGTLASATFTAPTITNNGAIIAETGLTATGTTLRNAGNLTSARIIRLSGSTLVSNTGTVTSYDRILLASTTSVQNSGGLIADADVTITGPVFSNMATGLVRATTGALNTNEILNSGEIFVVANFLRASGVDKFVNDGVLASAGSIQIGGRDALSSFEMGASGRLIAGLRPNDTTQTLVAGKSISLNFQSFGLDGRIVAGGDISLATPVALRLNGAVQTQLGAVTISAQSLTATALSDIYAGSTGTFAVTNLFSNAGDIVLGGAFVIVAGSGSFTNSKFVSAATIQNTVLTGGFTNSGVVTLAGGATINAASFNLTGHLQSGGNLIATATTAAGITNKGTLAAKGGMVLTGPKIELSSASFLTATQLQVSGETFANSGSVALSGTATNTWALTSQIVNAGKVFAEGALVLRAPVIGIETNSLLGSTQTITAVATGAMRANGTVTGTALSLTADSLTAAGSLSSSQGITVSVAKRAAFTGEMLAAVDVLITAADIDAGGSTVANGVTLTGTASGVTRGTWNVNGAMQASFGTSYQNTGRIEVRDTLRLTATTITNAATGVLSATDIDMIGVTGAVSSVGNLGTVQAARNVVVNATSASNGTGATVRAANFSMATTGAFANNGMLDVFGLFGTVGGEFANAGTVNAKTYLGVESASLANAGRLEADSHLYLKTSGAMSNAATGRILADAIDLRAASMSNLGTVQSKTLVNIRDLTGNFTNGTTGQILGTQIVVQTDAALRNDGAIGQTALATLPVASLVSLTAGTTLNNYGTLTAVDAQLIAGGALVNRATTGVIRASGALILKSTGSSVTNEATLEAGDIGITASAGFSNEARIAATRTIRIEANSVSNAATGTIAGTIVTAEAENFLANNGTISGSTQIALSAKGAANGALTNNGTLTGPDIALLSVGSGVYSTTAINTGKLAVEANRIGLRAAVTATTSVSLKSTLYGIEINGVINAPSVIVDSATAISANAGAFRGSQITQLIADDILRLDKPTVTNTKLGVLGGSLRDVYVRLRTGTIGTHTETTSTAGVVTVNTTGYETAALTATGSVSLITDVGEISLKGRITAAQDLYLRSGTRTNLQSIALTAGRVMHLEGKSYLKQYGGLTLDPGTVLELVQNYGWLYTADWLPATADYNITVLANTIRVTKDLRAVNKNIVFSAYDKIVQRDTVVSARQITYSAGSEMLIEFDPFDWRAANPGAAASSDWWDTISAGLRGHTLIAQSGGITLYSGRNGVAGTIDLISGKIHTTGKMLIAATGSITSEPIYMQNTENNRPGNVGWTFSSKYQGPLSGHALANVNMTEFRAYENQLSANLGIEISAGGNLELIGSVLTSSAGDIKLQSASGAVLMAAAPGFWMYNYQTTSVHRSWFGLVKTTTTTTVDRYEDIYKRTSLNALQGTVTISSSRTGTAAYEAIISAGTQIAAANVVVTTLNTQGNITLGTYLEASSATTASKTKSSFIGITYRNSTSTTAVRALINTGNTILADDILRITSGRNLTITGGALAGRQVTVTAVGTLNIQAAINEYRQSNYTERQNLITITTIQQGFDRQEAVLPTITSAEKPVFAASATLINGYVGASLNSQLLTTIGSRRFDNAMLGLTEVSDTNARTAATTQISTDRTRVFNLPGAADGPGFAYIDTLIKELGATYNPISLRDNAWNDKQVRLTPAFQALLSVAVGYFTGGAGLGITGVFQKAALDSLITGAIGGAITGNFDMEDILKGALLAGSSAYVSNFVTQQFNLGSALGATSSSPFINDVRGTFAPQMILDRLGDQVVSAGISNVFNGRPFFADIENLGRTFLVTESLALVQFGIGEMGNGMDTRWEGSIPHMLLHGGVGCIAIEALRGNCASGFFAGVSQSVLAGTNLTDAQKVALAPLVGAVAGFFGAEGQAIGVSYAATIAQSGMVNNYLTHAQWQSLTAEMQACNGVETCENAVKRKYTTLSRQQNDAYVNCVANGDMDCIQNVRDELSIVEFNKSLIQNNLANLNLIGADWSELLNLDQTALNITEIVYGDGNRITQEEAQAAFALDRAMLCTTSMLLATCLQTITDARRDRGNAALGLIADLIPILGDAKAAAECIVSPSALTCGGALLAIIPLVGDGAKILLKRGDTILEVTADGNRIVDVSSPRVIPEATEAEVGVLFQQQRRFWSADPVVFNGNKVYQRNDLIDPNRVDRTGRTNIELMQSGRAPIGPDGNPINLHHMTQTQGGSIAEVTQYFHQSNSSTIHINPNTIPSGINRSQFDAWKRAYWRARANDF